ncbi:MAG: radical SAM protein [Gemmatimonadetes bacterium]|nr:radical SAM protein [Gemmatimonadota bacterium]
MRKLATLKRLFDDRALYCQLIVTRKCNLACGYCNEFDQVSRPVPFDTLVQRMDHLVALGVTIMDFLGGEPLLHPRIAELVAHAKRKGCWTNIITNGLLLSEKLIAALNDAGLDSMCVSIDRVTPTDFTHKGLRPLRKKLRALRTDARFQVETNTVLCEETLDEFEALVTELKRLGFPVRCGVRHYDGRLELNERLRAKLDWFDAHFRHWRIAPMMDLYRARSEARPAEWKCTGGYKFLYVDEFGTVKACSQVALPTPRNVLELSVADLKANDRHKPCETDCGVSCVIQTSLITDRPFRYAARCVQHLLATRGNGVAYGGFRKASALPAAPERAADVLAS